MATLRSKNAWGDILFLLVLYSCTDCLLPEAGGGFPEWGKTRIIGEGLHSYQSSCSRNLTSYKGRIMTS